MLDFTTIDFILLSLALLACMLVMLETGWRIGQRRAAHDSADSDWGIGSINGAVFALFGLLLAFSFSGAADRFEKRRALISAEANAIGTAYLRLDLLPTNHQPKLRAAFQDYVDERLRVPHRGRLGELEATAEWQGKIWKLTLTALAEQTGQPITKTVLDPINEMIDITSTRWAASRAHPPLTVFAMLFLLALATALLAGIEIGKAQRRRPLHAILFALCVGTTIYVILDLEFPRAGLIRVDAADQALRNVLSDMRATPATD